MNKKNKQINQMVTGGLLLTASSFVSKFLSAIYKVPFQNLTGDEGFYVYQQVYPIYGLAVAFTMTGLPIFVSKVISEAPDDLSVKNRLQELHTWLVLVGFFTFILLQFGAGPLAELMGDRELAPVIQTVAYFFLFAPVLSLSRGFFQGQGNMLPTSLSQVIEQIVRVGILLWVAFYFGRSTWSYYEMGVNAYHSAWLSAAVASIALYVMLQKSGQSQHFHSVLKPRFSLNMGKRLFTEGFLLVAFGSLMIFFQFIDSFTVYNGLVEAGFAEQAAMAMKGVYDRGQPMVQLGTVVGISFSMTSLPILRKQAVEEKWRAWAKEAGTIIKLTVLLSSAAAIGLVAVMPWMNKVLFTDQQGTAELQMMMLSVGLVSFIYCIHTVSQSRSQRDPSLLFLIVGLGFKIMMNKLAVRIFGIMGSSIVTVMALLLIAILFMQLIEKEVFQAVLKNHFLLKLITLLMALYASVSGLLTLLSHFMGDVGRIDSFILTLVGVLIGVLIFGGGALWLNVLSEQEVDQLPLPEKVKTKIRK